MTSSRESALLFARNHYTEALTLLKEIVAVPSISTDPDHKSDMWRAADWFANQLNKIGFEAAVYESRGHPIAFGSFKSSSPNAKTILVYGHMDVQPVDPVELWKSDPFLPELRGEELYGRGASDMKGQVVASLKAVEAVLAQGDPGINIKFMIEGEEEIGSPNLAEFMRAHKDLLACDLILNPDSGMLSKSTPAITYALRGISAFEIRLYGPDHDLHSGGYGGVVHNPAQVLCDLLAGMHDQDGKVTLPGFYDKVRPLQGDEREKLSRLPITEELILKETGAPALWHGERGFTPVERTGARPTLEINGMTSGFTGQGSKTIIPAYAMGKISCRLVPDQNPEDVLEMVKLYLTQNAPNTVRWEIHWQHGGAAYMADLDQPGTKALVDALQTVWSVEPVYIRVGGSIPIVASMKEILGADSIITGFGLPDDHIHAPNEKLDLPTWYNGIDTLIHFFYNYQTL